MANYTVTVKVDSTGVGHTCAGLTVDKINVVLPVVMGLIPLCQDSIYDLGGEVSINSIHHSNLTTNPACPGIRLGYSLD